MIFYEKVRDLFKIEGFGLDPVARVSASDGRESNAGFAPGMYFCKMSAGSFTDIKKLMLVK